MSKSVSKYWIESVNCALDDMGCFDILTEEQRLELSESIELSASMESEACGYPGSQIDSRDNREIEELKKELKRERNSRFCRTCSGNGRLESIGPYHSSNSQCYKCKGEGRIYHE